MKYVIVIPDGAADQPLDSLDGKTPFEVANIPNLDEVALSGRIGTVETTPENMPCGSDVCSMSLLGYSPVKYHTGRAPLEAAALGIELGDQDWIFRVNFVTIKDGKMLDHSAGAISSQEGKQLLADLSAEIGDKGIRLHPGVSYRNIMVDGSGDRDYAGLRTTPPHDIPGEQIASYLPAGSGHAGLLRRMIETSESLFENHPINKEREKNGLAPATHIWPWGQGTRPSMPSFKDRYDLRGAMITAVDLLAGISAFIDWDRLDVPGQTSYHDNDYEAAGQYAIKSLQDYDIVCVHVEAPDEASHQADAETKIAAIEAIDKYVIGPVHEALKNQGEYRLLVLPDHYTSVATRKHDPTPPPFAMCGSMVTSVVHRPFNENEANESDLHIEYGHELMEYFLFSGLKR